MRVLSVKFCAFIIERRQYKILTGTLNRLTWAVENRNGSNMHKGILLLEDTAFARRVTFAWG